MIDFQATPELRWFKPTNPKNATENYIGLLQQKWTHKVKAYGTGEVLEEWRDVPTEGE